MTAFPHAFPTCVNDASMRCVVSCSPRLNFDSRYRYLDSACRAGSTLQTIFKP